LHQLRKAEQKVCPGVEDIRSRSTGERGQAACEVETAARAVGVLRLEMVNGEAIEFHAVASGVLPFVPTQVGSGDVSVIPELEGIGAVLIAQIREAAEEEARLSSTEGAGAIGAGNVEVRRSRICPEIGVLGGHALAQITKVGIQKQIGSEGIGAPNSDGLNNAGRIARLAAVEGGAARRSQRLGIEETGLLNAIASEERALAAEIEIDAAIDIVTSVLAVRSAKEVIVDPVSGKQVGAGDVRRIGVATRLQQLDHLARSVGDAAWRNDVVQEWRAASTIGIARSGIVDHDWGSAVGGDAREDALHHICGWNRLEAA